tara:strand:- start:1506 stop:2834 length:1329 start_codon:yes stop_codon:yes gene_type:complete
MQFYAKLLLGKQKNKRHGVIKPFFLLFLLNLLFLFITSCTTINQRNNSSSPIEIKTGDTATGTGFLFSSSNYVITNYHVVQGAKSINVRSVKGEKIDATIAVKDIAHDIVILKLSKSPAKRQNVIALGDSSSVKTGDRVFTYGFPLVDLLGYKEPRYSEGFVNSLSGISNDPGLFQVSIPIQPGNSGGPVFNENEELIGIATSSIDSEQTRKVFGAIPQNVNFAIKSSYITSLLSKLPDTFIKQKGIVVVPVEEDGFKERVKNDIVLVEAVPMFKPAVVKFDYEKEERFRKELERQLEQEKEEIRREKEMVERERKLLKREKQMEEEKRLKIQRDIEERERRLKAWERERQTDRRKAQRDNRNQFRKKLRHCDVACGPGTDTYEMIMQQQRQYRRMDQRRNRNRYSRYGTHYPWRRQDIEPLRNQDGNKPRGNFNFNIRFGN